MSPKNRKSGGATTANKSSTTIRTSTTTILKTTTKIKTTKTTTVIGKIIYTIRQLNEPGTKGSSRSSIIKYIKSEFNNYDNSNALKKAFKKGVSDQVLVQTGQSFRVADDPIIENNDNDEEQLVIKDLSSGQGGGGGKKRLSATTTDDDDDNGNNVVARHGDTVTVAYKGTLDDGYTFDSANKFTFVLGAGDVIKGWDKGVLNMRIGAKRKLIVPSRLGYGKRGCKPDIPPNATLTFIITLKGIDKAS